MDTKQDIFTLLDGRVKMQRGFYNPTSDAIWLAAMAPVDAKTVLDVGIGTGAVSLCILARNPDADITGLDISADMLDACKANAELNNAQMLLVKSDIMFWRPDKTFELVITNPPYFSGTPAKHNAHHNANLSRWVAKCISRVKPMGTFCIITDASTVPQVIPEMAKKLGDITIIPLFGSKPTAERVLLSGRLGTRGGAVIHQGLPMNYDPVLRDGLTINEVLSTLGQK